MLATAEHFLWNNMLRNEKRSVELDFAQLKLSSLSVIISLHMQRESKKYFFTGHLNGIPFYQPGNNIFSTDCSR